MFAMDSTQARFNMVEQQVRPWEVLDQGVLDAMMALPRENFVPEAYRQLAYADIRIPLGHGQAMFSPQWEGRLVQALAPTGTERALEIGTGSGYLAALLGALCREVISLDIEAEFVTAATRRLRAQGIGNVQCAQADALDGHLPQAPYDLIAVTASSPARRPALEAQLAPGGRLFIVVGTGRVMEALLITRQGGDVMSVESLFELELEALRGAETLPSFRF
jgi:protein-L-isoaspartate(D-aspartate) O-methyltransferase